MESPASDASRPALQPLQESPFSGLNFLRLCLLACLLVQPPAQCADLPATDYLFEDFEKPGLPDKWQSQGDVEVVADEKFSGEHSVRLSRTREKFDAATGIVTGAVPVRDGQAEFSGAFKPAIDSPDTSFNVSVVVEGLDGRGKVLETHRIEEFSGSANWTPVKKRIELSPGTSHARVRIQMNKAVGRFWADKLAFRASSTAAAAQPPVKRILLKTDLVGNLFLPGQPVVFDATVETRGPLPEANRRLVATVTDYWGTEQAAPIVCPLENTGRNKDVFEFKGKIDLSGFSAETGKYYELQTRIDAGAGAPAMESSSFVFLPEAAAKAYSWKEIPFSSRNWDNRLPAYFSLSDRLGIRLVGVWGTWSAKPPYEPDAPGFDMIQKLGLTMLARTPIVNIEHHRGGYKDYTETAMREGASALFKKYDAAHDLVLTLGNEPQPSGPTVAANVRLYKLMYEQVKKISPSTFVVGSSAGPEEEYFKMGFQKYSDAVDFHTYEDSAGLEKIFGKYRDLFAKYGGEQPIWATEMGLNSQGLSRRLIAGDLLKKFAWFFSLGGQNGSWFGICYPDREGKLRGSAEDSFNVFNGLYGNFCPRLDAIAYYNIINGICIKKFAGHRVYEGGLHSFLFADKNGANLQILWRNTGSSDVFIPLPGTREVKLTRIDGTGAVLDAGGKGVHLHITGDPVLLAYDGAQKALPPKLELSPVTLVSAPENIIRGETVKIGIGLNGVLPNEISLSLPPGWKSGPPSESGCYWEYSVTAPEETEARHVPIRFLSKNGDLDLILPVQGQLSAEIFPALDKDGRPAVDLVVRNNNARPETVDWKLSLLQEIPLEAGLYTLTAAKPAQAYFADASEGRQTVGARSEARVRVAVAGVQPLVPYKVRGMVTDQSARVLSADRFVGGFAPVPKAQAAPKLDGVLDEADWARCKPAMVDRIAQFRHLLPSSKWNGPDDLSAKLRFLWDADYLYVGIQVKDDVFRNVTEGSAIWGGDGVQLLIDPARASRDKPGKYDYAIGVGTKGPEAWCYLSADGTAPAGEVKDIVVATSRAKDGAGGMTYEIAIPWSRLAPFRPAVGADLGMAVILNEDDSPKRDGFMTWFGDIQSKEVDPVGDLILGD
jgi:hypothetical protein